MRQITLVTPAQAGLMADISDHLGTAGINIETLEAFVVRDWDIVQLTVSDYNRALVVLRDAGYDAITEDAVVINVKDQPGAGQSHATAPSRWSGHPERPYPASTGWRGHGGDLHGPHRRRHATDRRPARQPFHRLSE